MLHIALLLVFNLALVLSAVNLNQVFAQSRVPVPVLLDVPCAPTPVKADGKMHLLYELHITNFSNADLALTGVEIFPDDARATPLASYRDTELTSRLARIGVYPDSQDKNLIGGGRRAIAFLLISVGTSAVPTALHHRLFFRPTDSSVNSEEKTFEGMRVAVQSGTLPVIGPPVRGERWLAHNGLSNSTGHRRSVYPIDGKAVIAQRFATDWIKLGEDGRVARGELSKNENWYGYGAEVLAVTDATVVAVKDGIPENTPLTKKRAVPITLETIGGNYVILKLGSGHFASYAHLQPQSIRVKAGDRVRRGQVLGLLGNSGNSDVPHLHFHVTNTNSLLNAEGVPYAFESFIMQGQVKSEIEVVTGEGWKPEPNASTDKRQKELPVDNAVISFL